MEVMWVSSEQLEELQEVQINPTLPLIGYHLG